MCMCSLHGQLWGYIASSLTFKAILMSCTYLLLGAHHIPPCPLALLIHTSEAVLMLVKDVIDMGYKIELRY